MGARFRMHSFQKCFSLFFIYILIMHSIAAFSCMLNCNTKMHLNKLIPLQESYFAKICHFSLSKMLAVTSNRSLQQQK